MSTVIDLGPELLVDQSTIRNPYLRLLTAAVGQQLAPGSPWVAVNKKVAALCCSTRQAAEPAIRCDYRQPQREYDA